MVHPLARIELRHRCAACGDEYGVSLYEVLQEKRLEREWRSARPSRGCHANFDGILNAIPASHLEEVHSAWERLVASLPAGIQLQPV